MGRSRYAGTDVIKGRYYAMWRDPVARNPYGPDILDGVETIDHVLRSDDRLDSLAFHYYGDEDYWWIIALANRIDDPFALVPGRTLRIPSEAKAILDKIDF